MRMVPGIGDWTAQYIAMRALRWPDAFPAGDVALHKALKQAGLGFVLDIVQDRLSRLVEEFLAKHSFTEKQMGQAMGAFMKAHGGQVEPAAASAVLKRRLTGK